MQALLIVVCLLVSGCSLFRSTPPLPETKPVNKAQLVQWPFTFEPNVKNFSQHLKPRYKLQVYTSKNRLQPSRMDTIFKFYRNKSELFILKAYERELFVGGNIYDDKIVLRNGVRVGLKREDFQKCFTDLAVSKQDTVRLTSKHATNSFYFIFKDNQLKTIKIDNYFD